MFKSLAKIKESNEPIETSSYADFNNQLLITILTFLSSGNTVFCFLFKLFDFVNFKIISIKNKDIRSYRVSGKSRIPAL